MRSVEVLGWIGTALGLAGWFGWLTRRLVTLIFADGYGLPSSRLPGERGLGELPSAPYVLTPPR